MNEESLNPAAAASRALHSRHVARQDAREAARREYARILNAPSPQPDDAGKLIAAIDTLRPDLTDLLATGGAVRRDWDADDLRRDVEAVRQLQPKLVTLAERRKRLDDAQNRVDEANESVARRNVPPGVTPGLSDNFQQLMDEWSEAREQYATIRREAQEHRQRHPHAFYGLQPL